MPDDGDDKGATSYENSQYTSVPPGIQARSALVPEIEVATKPEGAGICAWHSKAVKMIDPKRTTKNKQENVSKEVFMSYRFRDEKNSL